MKIELKSTTRQITDPVLSARSPADALDHTRASRAILASFRTPLGWMGLLGHDDQLISVFVGHSSSESVRAAARQQELPFDNGDWSRAIRELFEAYADGDVVDFSAVEIRLPAMPPFREQVLAATRRLRYGETTSYGELANRVGHPGAARAVGTAMSTNRFPILIPCHRVLAAGGKPGGYTSPAGIALKQHMLTMESRAAGLLSSRHKRGP